MGRAELLRNTPCARRGGWATLVVAGFWRMQAVRRLRGRSAEVGTGDERGDRPECRGSRRRDTRWPLRETPIGVWVADRALVRTRFGGAATGPIRDQFARNLRGERQRKGISQERLARVCKLDRTEISLLERSKRSPRLETIALLAYGLQLESAGALLEGVTFTVSANIPSPNATSPDIPSPNAQSSNTASC